MEVKGFIGISLSDWDSKVSSVIFLPTCNLRCPFCYNMALVLEPEKMPTITMEQIESYLKDNQKWIDGVVVTGGEPTLDRNLPRLCKRIKEAGFKVKLDTNGTNPLMVKQLTSDQLVDYVALDIKAPLNVQKYSVACGVDATSFLNKIKETVEFLLDGALEYEFRTTVVPTIHVAEDIEEICKSIGGCKRYVLQNFRSEVETINPRFEKLKPFSKAEMETFRQVAKKVIPATFLRG